MSDEHAHDAMGCAGHQAVRTPNLDRLAARGLRFGAAYTPSPICIPARASLATGLHTFEHRCWSSAQAYTGSPESWMQRASAAGCLVESIGKLHFRSGDDDHGFAREHLPMYVANDGNGWAQGLLRDPLPDYPEAAGYAQDLGPGSSAYTAYDRDIAACAEDWLAHAPEQPWVLFVSFVSPHYPLVAPPEFYEHYRGAEVPSRIPVTESHPVLDEMRRFWGYDRYFADDAQRDLAARNYWGLVSFLDHNVGLVLDALDRSGQASDTVVIYTSDHGDMLGGHGFWAKSVMYEGSAAVPLILADPRSSQSSLSAPRPTPDMSSSSPQSGQSPQSAPSRRPSVNPTPASLIDIAPTIEQYLGIGIGGCDTAAARPWQARALQGFVTAPEPLRPVLSEYHDGGSPTGIFMIRCGAHKYVRYADGTRPQLFDLGADPTEQHDLMLDPGRRSKDSSDSSDRSETVAALAGRLERLLRDIVDPEAADEAASADKQAVLAGLGGREQVMQMARFDHTPAPGSTPPP